MKWINQKWFYVKIQWYRKKPINQEKRKKAQTICELEITIDTEKVKIIVRDYFAQLHENKFENILIWIVCFVTSLETSLVAFLGGLEGMLNGIINTALLLVASFVKWSFLDSLNAARYLNGKRIRGWHWVSLIQILASFGTSGIFFLS